MQSQRKEKKKKKEGKEKKGKERKKEQEIKGTRSRVSIVSAHACYVRGHR
jgi:hypothetical protein